MREDPVDNQTVMKIAEADFSDKDAFREVMDDGSRLHIDRMLPFLVLNRFSGDEHSLATRVAASSSAYFLWPDNNDSDSQAASIITEMLGQQDSRFNRVLIACLYDLPRDEDLESESQELENYAFHLGSSSDEAAKKAVKRLAKAFKKIEIDLRKPEVKELDEPYFEPELEEIAKDSEKFSYISIGLPQNYRRPERDDIFPQLFHELAVETFDALLKGLAEFMIETSKKPPSNYRALGRRNYINAAQKVDGKLEEIGDSFDFLLSVSPINTNDAFEEFQDGDCGCEPVFNYRPLTVDPAKAKALLYNIDLREVEDPVLQNLFQEKQLELDNQLTMLQCRNTDDFRYASMMLYGAVEPELLEDAEDILENVGRGKADPDDEDVGCKQIYEAAEELCEKYKEQYEGFDAEIALRDDIAAGLMVSGNQLLISTSTQMKLSRLDALLQHEVSVHLLTHINGAAQGLQIFGSGLAGYEGIQEGLGVYAECLVGGLNPTRLRLLAARVVVVDAMIKGASFMESYRILRIDQGFSMRGAFNITARIYRSGGLSKDAIYLRGLKQVMDLASTRKDLEPFWFGKIAEHHIPIIEELEMRGLLNQPKVKPAFLSRDGVDDRITKLKSVSSFSEIL